MPSRPSSPWKAILACSYLIIAAIGVYYSWGAEAFRPRWWLIAALAVAGAGLGFVFSKIFGKKSGEAAPRGNPVMPMLVFTLIQGGLGFAVSYYLFKLSWTAALTFPAGALIALFVWWTLHAPFRLLLSRLIAAGLLAGGLVIGLRLEGIPGSILYALALLNATCIGGSLLRDEEEEVWYRLLAFGAFLVAGRAAIQYFLLTSGYAALGVVVTHPYTFLALFAGIFLPLLYPKLEDENLLPGVVLLILLGLFLPLALGIFIHVRPMAAYLFGIVVSVFAAGVLLSGNFRVGALGYLSLIVACAGYPLFKETSNLSRVVRLEILGGIFLLAVIFYLVRAQKAAPRSEAS